MARTYKRDSNGRFASTGGARSGRPAAKPVSRGKNRITRDNAGRITSVGGEGATARGGRLRTAAGNKRAVQTARIKGGGGKLRNPRGSGAQPQVMRTTVMPSGQSRVPASQRPGSMTSTLRGTLRALAKADAQRIREIESMTGQKLRAPRSAPAGQGATVRAPGRGSVAGTLRDNLRQLAQSDARMVRGMAELAKPSAKGALRGGAGGKAGKSLPKGAPAQAGKSQGSSPRPSNKSPKGGNRWLSNEQVMQANEARGKDVRYTAAVMRSRLPKKEREASGVNTLGGFIAKYTGKPLSFAAANSVGDQIEKVTGVGRGQLKGVRKSIDNARRTVTYSLTPVARKQAAIAEKVGSRKPRRRKPA